MKQIIIADRTLCREAGTYSFKEKMEIARQLDNLQVDVIELPQIENVRTDTLLLRTIASFVKKSVLSLETGFDPAGVETAAAALAAVQRPRLRVTLPVSVVGMEYICHKKAPGLLELIGQLVSLCRRHCQDVEFCASDATRAEEAFVYQALQAAADAGARTVTICDDAGVMLPDELGAFTARCAQQLAAYSGVELGVRCSDRNGMAAACAVLAVKSGAQEVKTAVGGGVTSLETFADISKNCGESAGFASGIRYTQLRRIIHQIDWIASGSRSGDAAAAAPVSQGEGMELDQNDDLAAVSAAVKQLGYDLSPEDENKVFEEFQRVTAKKRVGARELEAIVASVALQVPPTYVLESYVINTGNLISATAQIRMKRQEQVLVGLGMGDGPIDAAFHTIEQTIGHHYELDDFQIQAVTEGKEAMGSALIRLRSNGKLYSGNGISTDIVGACIRAYLNALNKIVYEEA